MREKLFEYYGLREQPFGVTPNPRYFYPTTVHREALASLLCGIEYQAGFAALISEPGMGKTSLLFDLMARYGSTAHTAFIFNTQCQRDELLRSIADELNIETIGSDMVQLHSDFRSFLASQSRASPVLLILDEAQNLDDSVLESVRLLSDFETTDRKLLHIILAGQPQLAEKLSRPCLSQLLQRITMINRLQPLSPMEVSGYIAHRLRVAGYKGNQLFSPGALAEIAERSTGIPRSINRICFNALLLGYAQQRGVLDQFLIREVVSDLEIIPSTTFHLGQKVPIVPTSPVGRPPERVHSQPVSPSALSGWRPAVTGNTAQRKKAVNHTKVSKGASGKVRQSRGWNEAFVHWVDGRRGAFVLGTSGLILGFVLFLPHSDIRSFLPTSQSGPPETTDVQTVPAEPMQKSTPSWVVQELVPAQAPQTDASGSASISKPLANEDRPSRGESRLQANQAASAPFAIEQGTKPLTTEIPEMVAPPPPNASWDGEQSAVSLLRSLPVVLPGAPPVRSVATPTATQRRAVPETGAHEMSMAAMSNPAGRIESSGGAQLFEAIPVAASPAKFDHIPELISTSQIQYPRLAKDAGIQGRVSMKVSVSENGSVDDVKVLNGSPILSSAAVEAVRNWRYKPFVVNGHGVPFQVDVSIDFVNQH